MAEFFPLSPPPQSLETLDSWGALDSLPAPLDSPLWQSAGLYGLRIADKGRATSAFPLCSTACLSGGLGAKSSAILHSSVTRTLGAQGMGTALPGLGLLRLRTFSGGTAALAANGLLGVGVLYLEMDGAARMGEALHPNLTASLQGREGAGSAGALRLSFGLTLAPLGRAQAGARLELAAKGWNWSGNGGANAPQAPQDWTPHTSAGASWRELEQQRSSAWR